MQNSFDLIVVGGGAAGIMSAISAKRNQPNLKILLIDRTFALGRKILVCGAGRCNLTNINLDTSASKRYYGAEEEFVASVIDQFGFKQIIEFFTELGVETYVERKTSIGKIFPVTNQAHTITALLEDELQRLGIEIKLNTECISIKKQEQFIVQTKTVDSEENIEFSTDKLILSAGGRTYPALGSNGSGYDLAASLGHNIIEPVPSALPVEAKNPLSQKLQGVKLELEATSVIEGKKIKSSTDDVMFTKYGLSGPAILNISREISIQINRFKKGRCEIYLNFFPDKTIQEIKQVLIDRWSRRLDQSIENSLIGLFATKVPKAILELVKIDPTTPVGELTEVQIDKLANILGEYKTEVSATRGWNEAEFTAGGVDTTQVNQNTLESKLVKDLYFCGEILNVDGDVGGFNLSWAWASGSVAGKLK